MNPITDPSTLSWWSSLPQYINPTLITVFGFPIRYYGLMYLAAFFTCFSLLKYLIRTEKHPISAEQAESFLAWVIGGVLVGGRLGYILFYNFSYYLKNPLEAVMPFSFEGGFHFTGISGMSYHGGLIGAAVFGSIAIYKHKMPYWTVNNLAFTVTPLGYTWGRLGNFLNNELYGRATDSPIGMLFPTDKSQLLRHPSQLYEAFFEGIFVFTIIWFLRKKKFFRDHIMSMYVIGYGSVRFFIEYFREPDKHIGLNAMALSRGQILCIAMILAGVGFWIWREKKGVGITSK